MSAVEENASDNKLSENNYDWQDNIDDETKQSKGKANIQGGQVIVPDTNGSISKEKAPVDLSKSEDGSDEDIFSEVERILKGSPESSPKATCSTSDDVAVREALHNLECLLEKSLESILCDVELQKQLRTSLECIKQATHEKVSPNVVKLVQKMASSIHNLFDDFVMTKNAVEDHINALQKREKLVQLIRDGKKQKKSMKKEKSRFEDEDKRLAEEGEKLDEKIRILVEQKKSNELKRTKLKEKMERCEGEKNKVEDEAKNMLAESKELMSSIKNSKSSYDTALSRQNKLEDKWEGFRIAFAANLINNSNFVFE
ncbi:hypothetical protein MtrunA17_Chr5g0439961 [Medicago truncatula]|nr:hypothetical protein MtrunA17_Chr5g0439961 [Medicago truncatula]